MSEFEVDLGDGRTVVVDAPDAAQAANAARTFLSREKGSKPQGQSDAAANAFGQGATMGFGDEIAAGVRSGNLPIIPEAAQSWLPQFSNWMMRGPALQRDESIGGSPTPQTVSNAPTQGQRYDEELARIRAQTKSDAEAYPVTTTGANVAGTLAGTGALMMLPGGQALLGGGATSLPGMMLRGAASGAVLGGAQGFGEGEGGFDNRAANAVIPAAVGGAVGGVLPVVGLGAKYLYEKFAPGVLRATGNLADKFAPQVPYKSLSAAAPEGGNITQDSLAATIADSSRIAAGNIEGDAASKRLALEIARSGGTGRARDRLAALGEDAFIADTSKGAERLAELGATLKGEAPDKYAAAYTARNERTGERFLGAMGPNADAPGVSRFDKFFEGYRSGKGAEIYDPVLRGGKFNVSEELTNLSQRPSIKKALETVDEWAASEGKTLSEAERFHMVKQALNQNADAAFASGKPINKKMVGDTAGEWEAALYAANPAIREADTAYAKIASLPEWRDRGLNFMKRGYGDDAVKSSADALADELPRATAQQRTAAAVGSSNVMADAAKSGDKSTRRLADALAGNSLLKSKLVDLYGQEAADRMIQQSRTELAFQAGNQNVNAGSPTGRRIASMMDEAALTAPPTSGGDISAVIGWIKDTYGKVRQPSEAVRSRLADLLANPDPRMNAETLSLIDTILKQQGAARPVNAGLAGAAGGFASSPR
jgi:hypothetical protein